MRTRALVFVIIASGALMLSQQASAQVQAPGGVTIYDSTGCVSDVRDAKVTVPFSIGITGLRPNSSTLIFVTDKDAQPDIVYGPGIFTADENGNICLDILEAPVGLWKIDVFEQGSGFTDSKVFAIGESETPPITLPSTTTTLPPATTGRDHHDAAAGDDTADHHHDPAACDHRADHHHDAAAGDQPSRPPPRRCRLRPPSRPPRRPRRLRPPGSSTSTPTTAPTHPHHPTGHRAGVGDPAIR